MISKFLTNTLLSAVAILSIVGCGGSDDDNTTPSTPEVKISPYQRVAVIPGTTEDIQKIALKITDYVVNTDEKAVLGFPSNWVIAGANPHAGETYEGDNDLIPIPVDTGKTVYKSRVIEFCNGPYATQATNTGQQHGSALPCEVAVHSDGKNVYIDMLDADAIFTIFFPGIPDPEGKLKAMAEAVKGEIRGMIMASLKGETGLTEATDALGPKFTADELSKIKDEDIYLVTKYKSTADKVFTTADAKKLAQTIIEKMGTDEVNADAHVEGLSTNSKWRSARPDPIAIPGVFVTEACSPTYAKMATRLGAEYITALPCEITAYLDKNDDTNKTLSISILSPQFMFENMFKGAVENAVANTGLSQEDAGKYATLASTVLGDLNKIVDEAVANSGLELTKAP
jgi:uncharacterized protein (DUF302 family)